LFLAGTYFAGVAQLNHPAQAIAAFPTTLSFNVANTFSSLAGANNTYAFATGRPTTQYQISEDVVKIKGKHSFSTGGNFERIDWTPFFYQVNAPGTLTPQTLDAFYQGGVDLASPGTDFTQLTRSFASQISQRIALYGLGLYGQDEWHALPNLALTLALRAEHQSNPVCQHRCFARTPVPFESLRHNPDEPYNQAILIDQKQAFENTDKILWSPRFSFGWQPLGTSHNTVIRGGIGIFYDPVPGIPAAILSGSVWELPMKAALRGHGPDSLVKGWQVSGAIFARTGFPYTVIDFAESGNLVTKNSFGLIYAVPAGPLGSGPSCGEGAAIPLAPHPCQPPQVLADGTTNPQARFLQSGCETGFNTGHLGPFPDCKGPPVTFAQGKNHFRGPSYFNTDFAIMKNTRIPHWENAVLGIGLQFFNLFNHPNFGFPDILSSDQTFGQILGLEQPPTSILGAFGGSVSVSPRMIQLKAQLQF
jgi:hypothetical protein